jgi:hypothetical protein
VLESGANIDHANRAYRLNVQDKDSSLGQAVGVMRVMSHESIVKALIMLLTQASMLGCLALHTSR